jgi:hypothetical protein
MGISWICSARQREKSHSIKSSFPMSQFDWHIKESWKKCFHMLVSLQDVYCTTPEANQGPSVRKLCLVLMERHYSEDRILRYRWEDSDFSAPLCEDALNSHILHTRTMAFLFTLMSYCGPLHLWFLWTILRYLEHAPFTGNSIPVPCHSPRNRQPAAAVFNLLGLLTQILNKDNQKLDPNSIWMTTEQCSSLTDDVFFLHLIQWEQNVKLAEPKAHAYNPSYSGERDQKNHNSKTALCE